MIAAGQIRVTQMASDLAKVDRYRGAPGAKMGLRGHDSVIPVAPNWRGAPLPDAVKVAVRARAPARLNPG
jgi:hypothetical protein